MSNPDEPVNASAWPSVGRLAEPLVTQLCRDARMLGSSRVIGVVLDPVCDVHHPAI